MMLEDVSQERIQAMTPQELRWLDNAKKAFSDSDLAFRSGTPEDECLEALCKAIDTAKTLHRSLQGSPPTTKNNAKAFVDFIHMEIPRPEDNGLRLELVHSRTKEPVVYGFGKLVYEIRCMIHENENLNVDEYTDFHVLVDWKSNEKQTWAWISGGRVIVNGPQLWNCLREVLAKFLTAVDSMRTFPMTGRVGTSISPPLGSIRPRPKNAT